MTAEHVGYGRATNNPIDLIERLAAAHDWACDRTNDDELWPLFNRFSSFHNLV